MPSEPQLIPNRVLAGTIAAALVPGAGHLLARKVVHGLLILAVTAAGAVVAALHLGRGLDLFESHLGGFLFPLMLRGVIILYGFSVLDAYCWGVDPDGTRSLPARRQAVALNLLVPGSGYLAARAWVRAATGLALLVLIVVFARAGRHPYLDLIYIGVQLVMAVAVYHQMSVKAQQELDRQNRDAPTLPKAPGAQVVVLLAITAAVFGVGWVTQQALPGAGGLTPADLEVRPGGKGIVFSVPRLGMSVTAGGSDWTATANPGSGFLFSAEHKEGANLRIGLQQVPSFVRRDRYLDRIRGRMGMGLDHVKTKDIELNGLGAVQMLFSGKGKGGARLDRFVITVPSPAQKLAYLMIIECHRDICQKLLPALEATRDSFKIGR